MRGIVEWAAVMGVIAVAGFLGFSAASAESIEGSIVLGASPKSTKDAVPAETYYWKVWNGALPEKRRRKPVSDVLVVLTGKSLGPPIGCTFSFDGGALDPATLAARTGTTLRIQNRDGFSHEVAIEGLPGFSPLETAPNRVRTVTVPAGGPWRVTDGYYPHVEGYLHSFRELVACATVQSDGKFRFADVPPGPYSLRVLQGSKQIRSRKVVVSNGQSLTVDTMSLKRKRRK